MKKMKTTKDAYSEILKILNKYKDLIIYNVQDLEDKAKNHLFGIELVEKYGFNIDPRRIDSLYYFRLGKYFYLNRMGEKYDRTISWSDDDTQPIDEVLLCISFPTGAYIFGNDYPSNLFQSFFLELKSYKPKYVDSRNNSLYYSLDNASAVFNNFDTILEKYNQLNETDVKARKILKMKEELAKLEGLK